MNQKNIKINKKLKIFSLAKFHAFLFSLVGLTMGIIYSFGGLIYDISTVGLNTGTALAFLALLGMPMICIVVGFILGIIEALVFNLLINRFNIPNIEFRK